MKEEGIKVVKVTEPSNYSFWVITGAIILGIVGAVLIWRLLSPSQSEAMEALPNPLPNQCHEECVKWDWKWVNWRLVKYCADYELVCPEPTPTETPAPTETPEPTPEVTPEVTPEPTPEVTLEPQKSESKPEGCTHDCPLPMCTSETPQPVTNPHVYRKGDCALVKYWPSSDQVNIYWKQNSSGDWQYSLANQPATGNHDICGLDSMDITFGVQSVSGCAADGIVNASTISEIVDGACGQWVLFR